ncbi:hypothetical protein ACIPSE_45925 [Streptomyces sp. NPDC090106]|uniref:hypothetical protein n=1 Tax=Streptomyces sp. NPDC090106 TaxID=3365946 RepID=UPI0037F93567
MAVPGLHSAWASVDGESVEPRKYRVWLTPGEQVQPIEGVSYDQVPRHPLPAERAAAGGTTARTDGNSSGSARATAAPGP